MIKAQNFLMASGKPIFTPLVQVKTGQNPNKESWTKAFAAAEPEPEAPAPVLHTHTRTRACTRTHTHAHTQTHTHTHIHIHIHIHTHKRTKGHINKEGFFDSQSFARDDK